MIDNAKYWLITYTSRCSGSSYTVKVKGYWVDYINKIKPYSIILLKQLTEEEYEDLPLIF